MLLFLMTKGSPNQGKTKFVSKFIIESEKNINSTSDLTIYTFDEFFKKNKNKISFAIRRHWVGQKSKSENGRAIAILKNDNNKQWCFNNAVGKPRSGWKDDFDERDRKTVYTLSIEQK